MIIGFTYSKKKRELLKMPENCFRARLKFAWYPKKVINESIPGNSYADQEQLIWLEYYTVIEHFNTKKLKWIRNHARPFMYPDEHSIKEMNKPEIIKWTDPVVFIYWDMMQKAKLERESKQAPYKVEPDEKNISN